MLKRVDVLLLMSLAVVSIGFLILNLSKKEPVQPQYTEIHLCRHWDSVFDRDTMDTLIAEFEERNPLIRIYLSKKTSDTPEPNSADKGNMAETALGPNTPDIVFLDDSRLCALIRDEGLLPLNVFTQNPDNAGQWVIPLSLSMDLLFYNIDILSAAGFDRPPKTREEFLKYAQVVKAGSGAVYGTALGLHADDPLAIHREIFSWLWASGFSVIQDGIPGFEKRALADLIVHLSQVNQTGQPAETPFDKTGSQQFHEFARGKLAMIIAPAQAISLLREMPVNFEFGVTHIPGMPVQGISSLGLSGLYAGISASCAYPDEAWLFLSFIEENIPAIAAKIKAVPGRLQGLLPSVKGFSGDYPNEDPLYQKAWDIFESSGLAETFSGYPLAAELEQIIREELFKVFSGYISPANAAEAIQKRWEVLLVEN